MSMQAGQRLRALAVGGAFALLFVACAAPPERSSEDVSRAAAPAAPADAVVASSDRVIDALVPAGAPAAEATGELAEGDEIVVTGTRIRRDDFTTTNATVTVTAEDMRNLGVTSVAEMVAQLPADVASVTAETSTESASNMGASIANLRGLDASEGSRSLVLVDSSRVIASNEDGTVDPNMIPTALVGRVETVTGGASATYGADAMAGVVNVIVDETRLMEVREEQMRSEGQQVPAREALPAQAQARQAAASANSGAQPSAAPAPAQSGLAGGRGGAGGGRAFVAGNRTLGFATPQQFEDGSNTRSPFSRVSPGEELWIISQPAADEMMAAVAEDALGPGVMIARFMPVSLPDQPAPMVYREIPLPLKHTDVNARVEGYVGTVDVTQQFENPYSEKIEAVYMFPLPEKAAVSEFVMTIGERRIRGILRASEEAQQIYNQARAQGYQASLLTQHRPNVFEQKVANIEPGKAIDINIRYYETLAYQDGWYSFVFPTVVGPRYNPAGSPDPLHAVPQWNHQPTPDGAAVRYLTPGTTSAHDISIAVELDPGVAIEEIDSSHELETRWRNDDVVRVTLRDGATLPNEDFRLDFRVAGDAIKSNLLTYVDEESGEGYFTLMLYPPAGLEALRRQPLELVFVLDCSGSMNGAPLAQAKSAILAALDRLTPADTFQIIRFSTSASQLGAVPVAATPENILAARSYLYGLNSEGGTEMITGIRAALGFPADPERLRFVSFLTDGYIGNEAQILDEIDRRLGSARIFSFGVGSSTNRYLLERMAGIGRGAVAYLSLQDSGRAIMDAFFDRIAHPAMLDVEIDFGDMKVSDVYPRRLPDLFVGRPVVVTGRFTGRAGDVELEGRAGGERLAVTLDHDGNAPEHSFLPNLWARLKIAELEDRVAVEPGSAGVFSAEIRRTAMQYELMSDYTSFVAVDASTITEGRTGTTVYQAVPVPEGVRYESVVER